VHLVRSLLDEVFGSENFVAQINFVKTSSATDLFLSRTQDYVLWFAKDGSNVKYRALYKSKAVGGFGGGEYQQVELLDGTRMTAAAAAA
jgi:adenine-specific DNA-methyltransferase